METETIIINLPLKPNRASGRKYLISADGDTVPIAATQKAQTTMQTAIVRAFLWRRRIESGKCQGIADLARHERISDAFAQRQLMLTCLAPDVLEAIIANTQPRYWTLQHLYGIVGLPWAQQREKLCRINPQD